MMGVINEDKKDETIRNLIDRLGVSDAIKMVGNYYLIEPYLKEIDKVNYIKDRVKELGGGSGFGMTEIDEEPLHYGETEDGELHQIEWLGTKSVDVSIYNDEMGAHLNDYYVNYESLPGQILDELVEILLNH
jgi:hypothetical protein